MVLIYFALFESATMIPLVVCEGKHHELEMRFEIDVPKKYCGRILYHSVPGVCTHLYPTTRNAPGLSSKAQLHSVCRTLVQSKGETATCSA